MVFSSGRGKKWNYPDCCSETGILEVCSHVRKRILPMGDLVPKSDETGSTEIRMSYSAGI